MLWTINYTNITTTNSATNVMITKKKKNKIRLYLVCSYSIQCYISFALANMTLYSSPIHAWNTSYSSANKEEIHVIYLLTCLLTDPVAWWELVAPLYFDRIRGPPYCLQGGHGLVYFTKEIALISENATVYFLSNLPKYLYFYQSTCTWHQFLELETWALVKYMMYTYVCAEVRCTSE